MILVLSGMNDEAAVIDRSPNLLMQVGETAAMHLDGLPGSIEAAVSWGTAGSMVEYVPVGTVVLLTSVLTEDATYTSDQKWNHRILRAFPAAAMLKGYSSFAEVATTYTTKLAVQTRTGAQTIDMTAHAVAAFAKKRNIPFVAIQSISDSHDQDLVSPEAVREGNPNIGAALGHALFHPWDMRGMVREAHTFGQAVDGLRAVYTAIRPNLMWDFSIESPLT